ncbi:MAG: urease accessory protein UreD [Aliishimia sp.]
MHAIKGTGSIERVERISTPAPQRARGKAHVSAKVRDGVSVLKDLHQSGSMRVLFPRPASPPTAMLLNTAGGVTGGDKFDISVAADAGAHLSVTTQAAERIYRATHGSCGALLNEIRVEDGARLNWLPQETILFEGSHVSRRLSVDLAETAQTLIVEPLVFGRAAHGEILRDATFREHVRIRRSGRVIYADGIHLTGDIAAQMQGAAYGNGAGAMATLILVAPNADRHVATIRERCAEILGIRAGCSLLAQDLLLMRVLAHDSFEMRRLLLPVLDDLTGGTLPTCWRL